MQTDYEKFLEYNLQDVLLVRRIEIRMAFINCLFLFSLWYTFNFEEVVYER